MKSILLKTIFAITTLIGLSATALEYPADYVVCSLSEHIKQKPYSKTLYSVYFKKQSNSTHRSEFNFKGEVAYFILGESTNGIRSVTMQADSAQGFMINFDPARPAEYFGALYTTPNISVSTEKYHMMCREADMDLIRRFTGAVQID